MFNLLRNIKATKFAERSDEEDAVSSSSSSSSSVSSREAVEAEQKRGGPVRVGTLAKEEQESS